MECGPPGLGENWLWHPHPQYPRPLHDGTESCLRFDASRYKHRLPLPIKSIVNFSYVLEPFKDYFHSFWGCRLSWVCWIDGNFLFALLRIPRSEAEKFPNPGFRGFGKVSISTGVHYRHRDTYLRMWKEWFNDEIPQFPRGLANL